MGNEQRRGVGAVIENRVQHASVLTLSTGCAPEGLSVDAKNITRAFMAQELTQNIAEIRELLEKQMRVKGRDLRQQMRRAGRRLPRRLRRDLAYLIETETIAQNPKLGRMVNDEKVANAHANLVRYLEGLNPREAMWNSILNITASIALALIVTFVIALYVLVQRGFV